MSNAAERFGDALQSIIETAEAAGASKQDLIDSLESAIENLGAREFDPFDPTKPIRFYNYETDERGDLPNSAAVASLMKLDQTEIEWALEEFGRCDSATIVCWQPSENNGEEFPTAEAPLDQAEDHAEFLRQQGDK